MDFIDKINELASRVPAQLEYCQTEEATKTALIMPFINALGYNVFDPTEVIPEYTADIGIKKGEKVDYAIMAGGQPIMFFECKWSGANLNKEHAEQLQRYFSTVPEVHFGILTNGVVYRFFSDLDVPNRMDDKSFFEFNILDYHERDVAELKKFTKPAFDLAEILTTASELKYTAAITKILAQEFEAPSEGFMRFFASQVYSGRMTQPVREQFTTITRKALRQFLAARINERLQSALADVEGRQDGTTEDETPLEQEKPVEKREIVTTEEEMEGFFIVKSILRDILDVRRIHMRDLKSYCNVLLDDNNRKPLCRFRFDREQLYVGFFDGDAKDDRVPIDDVQDIYSYSDRLIATVEKYES